MKKLVSETDISFFHKLRNNGKEAKKSRARREESPLSDGEIRSESPSNINEKTKELLKNKIRLNMLKRQLEETQAQQEQLKQQQKKYDEPPPLPPPAKKAAVNEYG